MGRAAYFPLRLATFSLPRLALLRWPGRPGRALRAAAWGSAPGLLPLVARLTGGEHVRRAFEARERARLEAQIAAGWERRERHDREAEQLEEQKLEWAAAAEVARRREAA